MKSTKGRSGSKSASSKSAGSKGGSSSKSSAPSKSAASKGGSKTKASAKSASSKGASKKSASPKTVSKKTASKSRASSRSGENGRPQSANDLDKIFKDLLKDIYWAEKQLLKGLAKMSKNASNTKLKEAFTTHQSQTEDQVQKLDQVFNVLGMKAQGKKCAAMEGLLEESNEHIEEYEKGPGLDAALIVGAQKVEHYEIAAYGSLRAFAKTLGQDECAQIFEQIREQEADTDELLSTLAQTVNQEAVGSNEEEGGQSGNNKNTQTGEGGGGSGGPKNSKSDSAESDII